MSLISGELDLSIVGTGDKRRLRIIEAQGLGDEEFAPWMVVPAL